MKLDLEKVRPIVRMALKEDVGKRDITTLLTVSKGKKAKGVIRAKEGGIIAGLPVAELTFEIVNSQKSIVQSQFKARVKEGEKVKKGQAIAEVIGDARSILTGERTALNFLQRLSGIATLTNRFVEKVKPYKVKIFDTRKTTPGLRYLERYAVRCGGGHNHRMGLWDMVLIKDNHLKMQNAPKDKPTGQAKCPSLRSGYLEVSSEVSREKSRGKMQNLKDIVEKMRKKMPKGMKIEVEAKNLRQVREILKAGVDIIMLDNMGLKTMRKAVKLVYGLRFTVYGKPTIEASGGITLENMREIAKTGVNRISIGALTHSAKALDISLDIATAKTLKVRKDAKGKKP